MPIVVALAVRTRVPERGNAGECIAAEDQVLPFFAEDPALQIDGHVKRGLFDDKGKRHLGAVRRRPAVIRAVFQAEHHVVAARIGTARIRLDAIEGIFRNVRRQKFARVSLRSDRRFLDRLLFDLVDAGARIRKGIVAPDAVQTV